MGKTKVYAETERQRHKRWKDQLDELRSGISSKLRFQKRKQQEDEADREVKDYYDKAPDWFDGIDNTGK